MVVVVVVVFSVTTDFCVASTCVVLFHTVVVEVKGDVVIVLVDLVDLAVVVIVVLGVIVVVINKSASVVVTLDLVFRSKLLLNPNADIKITAYFKPFSIASSD